MLISISGAQSCGKSTLISQVCAKHGYVSVERKTSRSILAEWGVTLQQVNWDPQLTVKFQQEILKRKLADEAAFVDSKDVVFTERSFIDLFVYSTMALGNNNDCSAFLDEYYEQCLEAQKTYRGVILLTTTPVITADNTRSINKHYNTAVSLLMRHYAYEWCEDNLFPVTPMAMDRRIKEVELVIKYLTKPTSSCLTCDCGACDLDYTTSVKTD